MALPMVAKVGGACGLLVVAYGVYTLLNSRPRADFDSAYFWDESEQRLYTAEAGADLPHAGVGGAANDGYLAVVYTCSTCEESARQVAYVQRPNDALAKAIADGAAAAAAGTDRPEELRDRIWVSNNTLVRSGEDGEWVSMTSPEGLAITQIMSKKCDTGEYPRLCVPGER